MDDTQLSGENHTMHSPTCGLFKGEGCKSVSKDYRYIVIVEKYPVKKVCTGTMITDNLVITLASCLLSYKYEVPDPGTVTVIEPHESELRALRIFINPNFYSKDRYVSKTFDFGLIGVESSGQTVYPRLPQRMDDFLEIKDGCKIGGYGDTSPNSDLKVLDMKELPYTYIKLDPPCMDGRRVCLHFNAIIPCAQDRGAPMICKGNVLYAMYSPGHLSPRQNVSPSECCDNCIPTFTLVYNIKDWLEQIIHEPTSNLEWLNNPWYVILLCALVFCGMVTIYWSLMELLQRTFDPEDILLAQIRLSQDEESGDQEMYGWGLGYQEDSPDGTNQLVTRR